MRTGFFAFTLLVLSSGSALAAPFDNIITHNAAVPEQSFQIAATWFLPDWQASSSSRTETAPDKSGDRHDLTCSTYGGCAGIPANMTCSQSFRVDGTNCYKSCTCKSGYNRVSSSDVCAGCVNPCDTVTAVSTPYGCQSYWSVCPSKCQVAYPDNCRNRNAVSTPYGCKTTFADCSSKCQVAYPDNCHNRTAVPTPYGCQSAFADCSSKCQTAYPDNCRNYTSKPTVSSCANGCAQGKTISDCSSRCSTGCKAKCETGYKLSSDELSCTENGCSSGYEAGKTCGAGYELVKSGQSGTQYCGKCVVKACAAGSTTCSGATVAKENGYYSGDSKCYTCQTCEQAGKKTCNGSCIATSECCGGCASGQSCSNGTCVNNKTPEQICEEKGYTLNTYCNEFQARFYDYCPENRRYTKCYRDCNKFYDNAVAQINSFNSVINYGNIYYYKCGNNTSKCTDTITYRGVTYKYFTLDYNYVCVTKYNEAKTYFNNMIGICDRVAPTVYECPSRGMACNNYGYMAGGRELIIGTEACCCSCSGSGTPNGQCFNGSSEFPINPTGTGGGTSTT